MLDPDGARATFTYDANGNLTQMGDWTGTSTRGYDGRDLLTSAANPDGRRLTYTWDGAGRRETLVDPDGGTTTYVYDAAGRRTQLVNPFAETTTLVWDDAGRQVRKELDNGTWTSITYDAAGRTTAVANLKSDDTVISSFDYAYDGAGNRLSVAEDSGDRVTWTYDRTYQLLTEDRSGVSGYTHTFSYDPVGNRLTAGDGTTVTTSVYDDANRLQTAEDGSGVTTYTFDANGNQRTVETPAGDVTTYVWDYENQMASGEDSLGAVTTYTYTAAEQRVGKETAVETVKFLWDGQNIVQEYDESDVTQADYTNDPQPAPQPFGNLVSQRRDTESSFYSFDALGSTRNLTDDAEVETDDYAYEAFGKVAASSGTTENPFQWTGAKGVYTQEDERRWMRAREMDAASGRFMSEDPARDDSNLYRYTGNNPASKSDPSGLAAPHESQGPVSRAAGDAAGDAVRGIQRGYQLLQRGLRRLLQSSDSTNRLAKRQPSQRRKRRDCATQCTPQARPQLVRQPGGYPGGWWNPGNWLRGLYTGDPNAPDAFYSEPHEWDPEGEFVPNLGRAHNALNDLADVLPPGLSSLPRGTSSALEWMPGEELTREALEAAEEPPTEWSGKLIDAIGEFGPWVLQGAQAAESAEEILKEGVVGPETIDRFLQEQLREMVIPAGAAAIEESLNQRINEIKEDLENPFLNLTALDEERLQQELFGRRFDLELLQQAQKLAQAPDNNEQARNALEKLDSMITEELARLDRQQQSVDNGDIPAEVAVAVVKQQQKLVPWQRLVRNANRNRAGFMLIFSLLFVGATVAGGGEEEEERAEEAEAEETVVPLPPHLQQHVDAIKAGGRHNGTVGSLDEARQVIREALPDAVELPPAVAGQPYPSPPPGVRTWYQVQPAEPNVGNNLPHIKYADWTQGKKGTGGRWGHLFFPETGQ